VRPARGTNKTPLVESELELGQDQGAAEEAIEEITKKRSCPKDVAPFKAGVLASMNEYNLLLRWVSRRSLYLERLKLTRARSCSKCHGCDILGTRAGRQSRSGTDGTT
jgi:hypothetical protein